MSTNSLVYNDYRIQDPPKHPGQAWTRFVCISDTHSCTDFEIPPGDVLIHAGDISNRGTYKQIRKTVEWLCALPHELKIVIAGNHDLALDLEWKTGFWGPSSDDVDSIREFMRSKDVRDAGIIYLDHEQRDIMTSQGGCWKVYGSPAAPLYVEGAFQYSTKEEAIDEWAKIPADVEILLTHTPPANILDQTRRGKHAGCDHLAARLHCLTACRLHVFGHIHEACGATVTGVGSETSDERLVRVSVNAGLPYADQPVIVDLRKDST